MTFWNGKLPVIILAVERSLKIQICQEEQS